MSSSETWCCAYHRKGGALAACGGVGLTTVDGPAHYRMTDIEPIAVIEAWELGFCLGNCIKYIARHEHKGSALEDLKKARWYLDREIARREGSQ